MNEFQYESPSLVEKLTVERDRFQAWLAVQLRNVDERRAFMNVIAARGLKLTR